jgi:hypothetical protein
MAAARLLVVGPHTENLYNLDVLDDLVDQAACFAQLETGVFIPLSIDLRIPGAESKYSVSCMARQ